MKLPTVADATEGLHMHHRYAALSRDNQIRAAAWMYYPSPAWTGGIVFYDLTLRGHRKYEGRLILATPRIMNRRAE